MHEFPKDFLWGAANSAYQVEGNNSASDWWEWEKKVGLKDLSADACRHYELYRQDFDLAKQLGHNAHRFSIEWSRIEPEEGRFSQDVLRHYQDVVSSLRERGIEPVVTLHHFTCPVWFARKGGWLNPDAAKYFLRYAEYVVSALCDKVRYWVSINEPLVYSYYSYSQGAWPPQEKSFVKACRVCANLIKAHVLTYGLIRGIYAKNNITPVHISIAHNLQAFVPCGTKLSNRLAASLRNKFFNLYILEHLIKNQSLDFIGINYYTRNVAELKGWGFENLAFDVCLDDHRPLRKNSLGWDIYPEGLCDLLLSLKRYGLPVMILENGICTEDDGLRWEFIREHLRCVSLAMAKGSEVWGYLYWSLLDNYEWDKGFGPHFGLIEVDYRTQRRTVRESARRFSEVCKTGRLNN